MTNMTTLDYCAMCSHKGNCPRPEDRQARSLCELYACMCPLCGNKKMTRGGYTSDPGGVVVNWQCHHCRNVSLFLRLMYKP
jgi:hypothetical protein